MRWLREHWRGLLALLVAVALASAQATYGAGHSYPGTSPTRLVVLPRGETAQIAYARVRLLHAQVHQSLPGVDGRPAGHPPGTKFVVVTFEATMLNKKAVKQWRGVTATLRASDGRRWGHLSAQQLTDAKVTPHLFGGTPRQPVRPGVPVTVQGGFVVPNEVAAFTVEISGPALDRKILRFTP